MATTMDISPSPEARKLFSSMVARAEGPEGRRLSLASTIALSVERKRMGRIDLAEVHELCTEGWIEEGDDGGWKIL